MFWLTNILLFVCGAAGAASMITRRFPEFSETLSRISKLKGLLGFVLLVLALGRIIDLLFGGIYSGWMVHLIEVLLMFALGLIQGIGILKQLIQNEAFIQRIESWRIRLIPYEEMLGLTAMVLSVFTLLRYIF